MLDWIQWAQYNLDIWTSTTIVVVFSFIVIGADEFIIKAWRDKHWEKLAESGDKEKAELLKLARSANVVDE